MAYTMPGGTMQQELCIGQEYYYLPDSRSYLVTEVTVTKMEISGR